MRKIIIFIVVVFGLFLVSGRFEPVSAVCQCVEWANRPVYLADDEMCPYPYEHIVCKPAGWYDEAYCVTNSCGATCGPGSYVCNRETQCCAVGSGTPGGGGGGPDPIYGGNCPSGTVVDYNQPIATVCSSQEQGYQMGNAQQITGCCREVTIKGACEWVCEWKPKGEVCRKVCAPDETNCAQNYYTTYACVSTCTPSCSAPLCGQSDGCGGTCASWDQAVWGAWSACSASCGGGVQIRTNPCGGWQSQSCNTQSCQDSWWQVKDSDVSSNGDLITNVPSGKYFDMDGTGGFPGIPAASGTTDLDGTNVSSTGWIVDSLQTNAKVYDHAYFNNQIPKDTVITVVPSNTIDGSILESGGTLSYGYYWYRYDGSDSGLDLTITAPVDLGSRKVILLVDSASLYINGSINLTDGEGFFVSLVSGNINIAGTVATLEGIYESNGSFTTGAGTSQLLVRGG